MIIGCGNGSNIAKVSSVDSTIKISTWMAIIKNLQYFKMAYEFCIVL